ncbi:hypothetical protein [Cytophaga hutchinsonii]|uniref:Glycosyltransferase RgtA/B/C/D-like domain-containing protein n=1 Tax=Cytophaga hutchinsonii (strain ATCC 33406 / DSM 1761 / CIP 103989 / NBRC 15051 / NCIMB 9469 / D465) TaxID=269798 RepID=A0A6N4SM83_CYTH3|nr:hypothetical protein [Cytophaga hutchinsonii]ABG57370.1 conserved hypothetical protein [Cytophaga hutchinsonii ATCC 33406]SFX47259.1 hypothetical protein SAMN04487930_104269 [Cytophaga hutchinsonii ATCC 33406]
MKSLSVSKFALIFILSISLIVTGNSQKWKEGVIEWDIISYYAYLPGLIIYEDLTFNFLDKNTPEGVRIWTENTPENKKVIKMSSGLAILYSPFFLMAHGVAKLQPEMYVPNGYSMVYSLFLILSDIFYTFLGFIFLRKILIRYFSDMVTGITLLCVFFGTNMIFYSMFEVMAHCYLFCLITMFVYYTIKWHETPTTRFSIYLGLLFGLITLIRPVDIVVIFLFVFYGIHSFNSIKPRITYLWSLRSKVILIGVVGFLVFCIQIAYWKYATGHFLYWSYTNEYFFWTKPHIIEGLIGFRKGWYIYSPIMLFATIGLFFVRKKIPQFSVPFILLFVLYTYIIFCWWCWWYGGGISCRPMVDLYGVMGIGLASFITYVIEQKYLVIKYTVSLFTVLFVLYGALINIQYLRKSLHYDSMTFEAWKIDFLKLDPQGGYYESLQAPDYDKALKTGSEK